MRDDVHVGTSRTSYCPKSVWVAVAIFAVLILMVLGFPGGLSKAYAEGSKNLTANGGYRPYTERYGASTAGEPRFTEIGVYAQAGETLYFGSSVRKATLDFANASMGTTLSSSKLTTLNDNDILLCTPDWNRATNPKGLPYINGTLDNALILYNIDNAAVDGGLGYIANRAAEVAGPKVGTVTSGYNPFSYLVPKTGIYYFKFYSPKKLVDDPKPVPIGSTENFEVNQGSSTVAAWDVTVKGTDGQFKTGRVFTDKLFLNMGGNVANTNVLNSAVYVLTRDGYEYKMDFNGMDPFGFMFFSNSRGLLTSPTLGGAQKKYQSLYHSVKSNVNTMADLSQHNVLTNVTPTEANDITHRIFFNPPDAVALQSYTGAPSLSAGSLTADVDLDFTPAWNPDNVTRGTVVGFGGEFSFNNPGNIAGSTYQITLDFGNTGPGGASNKVILSNTLVSGKNAVLWDGVDQYGRMVPAGTYINRVSVQIKGGEVHFPLFDVENNRSGLKLTMMNNIAGMTPAEKTRVFYNNKSTLSVYTDGWTEANWTVADKVDASGGVDSSNGAMKFSNESGDMTALDIWEYHAVSAEDTLEFEVYEGSRPFTVTKVWNQTSVDTSTGSTNVDSTDHSAYAVDVQLQWRVKGSGEPWKNYDGSKTAYHDTVSMTSSSPYVFSDLEKYAGMPYITAPLYYEYRVLEMSQIPNYLSSIVMGTADGVGVSTTETINNQFSPGEGNIIINARTYGDSVASGVRPTSIVVELFYRDEGTDGPWLAMSDPDKGLVTLSAATGWSAERSVWLSHDDDIKYEYTARMVSYVPQGSTQPVTLDSSHPSPEGYAPPTYLLNGGSETPGQSEIIRLDSDYTDARVTVVGKYTTQLVVTKKWKNGTNPNTEGLLASVELLKDGVGTGKTAVLTPEEPSYAFTGLETGHAYTAQEVTPAKYVASYSGLMGEDGYAEVASNDDGTPNHGFTNGCGTCHVKPEGGELLTRGYSQTITNTYNRTQLTVNKVWNDGANVHDPVHVTLSVVVSGDDESQTLTYDATLSSDNGWTKTFGDLPVNAYSYDVVEDTVSGYDTSYSSLSGDALSGYAITVTNTVRTPHFSFDVAKNWVPVSLPDPQTNEPTNDPYRHDDEDIDVQLQWRIQNSGDAWANYAGSVLAYHAPVSFMTGETLTFSNLERWVSGGTPFVHRNYEYRAVETSSFENYLASTTLGGHDLEGVATNARITNRFSPDQAIITVHDHWLGDERATGVRPKTQIIQLVYRDKGSDGPWLEFNNPDEGLMYLSSANSWIDSQAVWLKFNGKDLEYSAKVIGYIPEGSDDPVYLSTFVQNAPGYARPTYSVDGSSATTGQADTIDFSTNKAATIDIVNTYTTQYVVNSSWDYPPTYDTSALSLTVELMRDGVKTGQFATLTPSDRSHTFTGLTPGCVYTTEVRAISDAADATCGDVLGEDGYSSIEDTITRGYKGDISLKLMLTVRFIDWNETLLKAEKVPYEGSAAAPSDPTRTGYTFTGWDKEFSCITEDTTVTAAYRKDSGPSAEPTPTPSVDSTSTTATRPTATGDGSPYGALIVAMVISGVTLVLVRKLKRNSLLK